MIEYDGQELTDVPALLASTAANFGHYTAFAVSGSGTVRGLSHHLDRLTSDSVALFGRSLDREFVLGSLRRVAAAAERPVMLRATIFGPELHLLVSPRAPSPLPAGGLRVLTVHWLRDHPTVKHTGLFGAARQRSLAQAAGVDDALFLTPEGLVAEGPTWNVAVSTGGELVWPDDQCLPGTTRTLLRHAGVPWVVRSVSERELGTAEAVFATSAGIGARPVTEIDGRPVPGDPDLTSALHQAYAALPTDQLT